ncbi:MULTISPECIES: SLC13 family permease [Pantoea]|uniref:Membrane protein n=2 Tax=Pantoea stewartii TaxID=66269 RepID=A0AB34VHJ0_9GAMM|nr:MULTISPECIES: SLC13 family permease [Pantoea]KKW51583.1 membrane protein [Pantoea ananatis]ARF49492.1 anion transporter [Pantoea stewartii subsp. stewartii DC283]KAB0553938.1 anion transporter [Pantoea stewartii subsp. stewartii]KTS72907.1 membrane protein [Pantoea stewartii]KTS98927.1 membrane protein [Pantoea stewartii]
MPIVLRSFLHDHILHLLVVVGVVLLFLAHYHWADLPAAVDWHTIITLSGLLILTKGLETSGYFDVLGGRLIAGFKHERTLALFMVLAAAVLSTFLTNDVALFILVPLTLTLRKFSHLPISRLIIFEALAVNAGSLLTPVGNPQNILLWSHGSLSVVGFIWQMTPLAVWLLLSLLVVTWFSFAKRAIEKHENAEQHSWQKPLFAVSLALYVLFIAALEWHLTGWALLLILVCFFIMARQVLLNIDWSLLVVFIVMFLDVFLLTRLPVVQAHFDAIAHLAKGELYLLAIGLSQVISNVPATILLLQKVPPSDVLAWAVNIGGFGLLPGSLANLIALRMAKDRAIWWRFHLFSVPLLAWSMLTGWLLLKLVA